MSALCLMRLAIDRPALMRFAQNQRLLDRDDEGFGYTLHAWLAAMFGAHAPKPFRYLDPRGEVLGYVQTNSATLLDHARAFAPPLAHSALVPDSLATKPMPDQWRIGQRLQIEVLACPVSRKDDHEKDVYLRALDRLGDAAPPRGAVYVDWFQRQWAGAVQLEHAELAGVARRKLLRRGHADGGRQPRSIERPQALFRAVIRVTSVDAFGELLARGIGRHRAFGFGMVLLSPPP